MKHIPDVLNFGIQTATLWIYHVHPTRIKRAGSFLNLPSQ